MVLTGKLLLLLLLCNGAPILARNALGERFGAPIDFGRFAGDGEPLLGRSKTWRGLAAALATGAVGGAWLGLGAGFGLAFAAAAMAGDVLSSFAKRRLGIAASGRAVGLDQVPEALFPALYAVWSAGLAPLHAALLVGAFFAVELTISPLLHRIGVRERPY